MENNDTELKPFDNSNDVGYSREKLGKLRKIKDNNNKIILKIEENNESNIPRRIWRKINMTKENVEW